MGGATSRRAAFRPAQDHARPPNAPAALRSRHSGSGAARGDAVGRDTGGGRVRKWGRGGRERAWGGRGVPQHGGRETLSRAGAGGAPRPPPGRWRRKKVTSLGSSAPTVARGLGKGGGGSRAPEAGAAGGRSGPAGKSGAAGGGVWRNSEGAE